ncbi:MAG TPA: class I SAM-dependent methyltransferase [Verrucomicrobiales bacterium]|nr:class I SAM-dependent methyltransferase [Verrucomicrobiales bacterium]
MAVMAVFFLVSAILSGRWQRLVPVTFMVTVVVLYLDATRRGKFVVWTQLLDKLRLRGDERILDLGCGRGAVLLMAAERLTRGRAVGVDLWQRVDQSGNCEAATRRNAVAEGVADRVELHTGDMTALPFEDDSFDVVLSSFAIHNIRGSAGREKAIAEAVRVLRPGGRLMITDVRATKQYYAQLARMGMNDVVRRRLGWQFWRAGASAATPLVTATKPERLNSDRQATL